MKNTRKLLSIILAILMIATTVPFAFAADEIPDFSDAKVLTADADGYLCVDGEKLDIYLTSPFNEERQVFPAGKYKLEGDIITKACVTEIKSQQNVIINLNGYTWEANKPIYSGGSISVYDTSAGETGRIVATGTAIRLTDETSSNFNLYSGTVETTGTGYAVNASWGSLNLYGGKIKSNGSPIFYYMSPNITINFGGTVLEVGEGYAHISGFLSVNQPTSNAVIDVTYYKGESLTVDLEIVDTAGKLRIFKGISVEDAEKYTVNVTCSENYDCFFEKEEYDEATGEKYIYIAENAFTQRPSAENNYTVDFNNPNTSFQWYEVEENYIGKYIAEEYTPLFSYDFKAGDTLKVSTDSELKFVHLRVGDSRLTLRNEKTATVKIDTDGTMIIESMYANAENPVELEFSVIKETELEGETGKTLHKFECGKSYCCKATVGNYVYVSDTVTIAGRHVITQVDAKAPTCTEFGWDAYEYCTACYYTTYNEIPATNHKDTLVEVEAKANTCTEIGWDAYEYCTVCDYTTYVEKAALDHDIVIDAYVAPQCTETGLTAGQHCSRCDDMTIVQEVIPDLGGHINEDGNTTCDRCDEILLCEDCGRPVHKEEGIPKYICWLITLIKMIVSFFK